MQAEFGDEKNAAILPPIVRPYDATTRRFGTSHVYRAYINSTVGNPPGGVGPGHTVTITVPFYTQLQDVTKANLGINSDEFIDWWNAVRIYFFYGPVALNSALINPGSPVPVNFSNTTSPTQTKPTCSIDDRTSCVVDFITHTIDPLANIPFQLQEYTFASASGPKPGGVLPAGVPFKIDRTYVNYNVSSLDLVYLPLAIGPYNFNDPVGDSPGIWGTERLRHRLSGRTTTSPTEEAVGRFLFPRTSMRAKVHRDGPRSKANPVLSTLPSPMPRRPSRHMRFRKSPALPIF